MVLKQNENGVLSGSEIFYNTTDQAIQQLFYYTDICGHYYCDDRYHIRRHNFNSILLLLVETGTMYARYCDAEMTAHAGDIILIDCMQPHYYAAKGLTEFYWLHIGGPNCYELFSHLTRQNGGVLYRADSCVLAASSIRRLVRQFITEQLVSQSEQARQVYNILCYLMPAARQETALQEDSPIQHAVKYIQSHLGDDLSLKRLAAEVHLSSSHLIRLFRAELQHSPHEYIVLSRLNRAKYLLKTTDMPVKAIAAAVGYGNESSFTGAFTEKIGISPRQFRSMPLE